MRWQYEAVEQGHHHPCAAVRIEFGWHAACLLAVAERFGNALADVLEAGVGPLPQAFVAQQLTPGLDRTAQQLIDGDDRARCCH